MSFGSSAQKGCYCALSTAASHGQRKVFELFLLFKKLFCIFLQEGASQAGDTSYYAHQSEQWERGECASHCVGLGLGIGVGVDVSFNKASASVDIVILGVELRGDPCGGCAGPGELCRL